MNTTNKLALVLTVAVCSPLAAHARSDLEPLVSCMIQKATRQTKEAAAGVIQEGLYCPPADSQSSGGVACPVEENYRLPLKRAVFDLTRECSKEFPSRATLPEIEAGFLDSLRNDTATKAMIDKRKDAYEKSRAAFEKAHPAAAR